MNLYPALDLLDGTCVRLKKGDFEQKTIYSDDPHSLAKSFEKAGAKYLHLVDLSGAKNPGRRQTDIIRSLVIGSNLKIQCGGGIRSRDEVAALLDCGVERVVLGSIAVSNPPLVKKILEEFGGKRITLALDVVFSGKSFYVAVNGWKTLTETKANDLILLYRSLLDRVLCTDISLDGMMAGPNVSLYQTLLKEFPEIDFQASGGMSKMDDLENLASVGVRSAVIGKALYEGSIDLTEALRRHDGGTRAH